MKAGKSILMIYLPAFDCLYKLNSFVYLAVLRFIKRKAKRPAINKRGKTIAANKPTRRLSSKAPEIKPTKVGPPEQPKSPASARKANIAVPPARISFAAMLKVPGHKIPTESPQSPQPIRPMIGIGTRDIRR